MKVYINLLQKADLIEKSRKSWIKKIIKNYKTIYKNKKKKIIKPDDVEIEKCKFHQYKSPILIGNIDINKIVSNKVSFGKMIWNILLVIKMLKKLDLYAYSFQKQVHIEEILIELNVYIF